MVIVKTAMADEDHYEKASDSYVQDGHLVVVTADNSRVAVYAPGQWVSSSIS